MTKTITAVLPLAVLLVFASVAAPVCALQAATTADSMGTQTPYGDVNQDESINIFDLLAILRQMSGSEPATEHSDLDANGKTDIFDLLAILRLFGDMREPLEVAATVGGHWLTEPMVYSYSHSWDSTGVRDRYQIYSNHEIDRAEIILDGDTVSGISGTTPILFAANPDTVEIEPGGDYRAFSEPKAWKITAWDKLGNCVSDSGVSQFMALYPGIIISDSFSNNVGEEITFPLTLYGKVQRFCIKANKSPYSEDSTFIIDLNPVESDSVVYEDIKQLASQIMEQIVSNDSLWPLQNIFGEPALLVTAAVSRQTQSVVNRLYIHNGNTHYSYDVLIRVVALNGNNGLIAQLGLKKWIQDIREITYNYNFELDPEVWERYK
jgi:hypothetical protein